MPEMGESGTADDQVFVGKSGEQTVYGTRGEPQHLKNRADAAWEELQNLRAEARRLGIPLDGTEPLATLREYVKDAQDAE